MFGSVWIFMRTSLRFEDVLIWWMELKLSEAVLTHLGKSCRDRHKSTSIDFHTDNFYLRWPLKHLWNMVVLHHVSQHSLIRAALAQDFRLWMYRDCETAKSHSCIQSHTVQSVAIQVWFNTCLWFVVLIHDRSLLYLRGYLNQFGGHTGIEGIRYCCGYIPFVGLFSKL